MCAAVVAVVVAVAIVIDPIESLDFICNSQPGFRSFGSPADFLSLPCNGGRTDYRELGLRGTRGVRDF